MPVTPWFQPRHCECGGQPGRVGYMPTSIQIHPTIKTINPLKRFFACFYAWVRLLPMHSCIPDFGRGTVIASSELWRTVNDRVIARGRGGTAASARNAPAAIPGPSRGRVPSPPREGEQRGRGGAARMGRCCRAGTKPYPCATKCGGLGQRRSATVGSQNGRPGGGVAWSLPHTILGIFLKLLSFRDRPLVPWARIGLTIVCLY